MADDDDLNFDFEANLEPADAVDQEPDIPPDVTAEEVGQQPANFKRNYRQTVCTYWLRGLCMKGDSCGFLHQFDPQRMPVCRTLIKTGKCDDLDCPYKHSLDEIKECNMYKLGFCIYGSTCRYKHTKTPGPPPDPSTVEGAKPKEFRDKSTFLPQDEERDRRSRRPALPAPSGYDRRGQQPLALPAPEPPQGAGGQGGYGGQGPPADQQFYGGQPQQQYGGGGGGGAGGFNDPIAAAAAIAAAARAGMQQQGGHYGGQQEGMYQQQQRGDRGGGGHRGGGGGGGRQKGMPLGMHLVGGGGFMPGMGPGGQQQQQQQGYGGGGGGGGGPQYRQHQQQQHRQAPY